MTENDEILRQAQDDGVERDGGAMQAGAASPVVIPSRGEESVDLAVATTPNEHGFLLRWNDGMAPAPSAEEAAAIVAALLLFESGEAVAAEPEPISLWAMAGRRAAHLGRDGGAAMGWGRLRDERRR